MIEERFELGGRTIEIRRPKDPSEYKKLVEVQLKAWGAREAVPHHALIAIDRRGGLVLGAFDAETGEALGICFGILAKSSDGKLYLYSHMTGVVPDAKFKGIGFRLKLKQREWAISQGLELVAWTYDPLQAANAYFNLCKLGAIARKFYANYYGELDDAINYGMPTDRLEAEWWVRSKRVEDRLSGAWACPSVKKLLSIGAELVTKTEQVGRVRALKECALNKTSRLLLAEVPESLAAVREESAALLAAWREGARRLFEKYLNEEGYVAADVACSESGSAKRVFYVLWRGDVEQVLEGSVPWR